MESVYKSELRKIYSQKRKELTAEQVESLSKKISENLLQTFDWNEVQNVHIFLPIKRKKEVNTFPLINFLWKKGKNVFVPKVVGKDLECHQIKLDSELVENDWGILEPEGKGRTELPSFDMAIIPLLYCDAKGNRVGYGKGFYDRFFTKINFDAVIKIGVNYFSPNEEVLDVFSGDIPLDYLVSSERVFSFKSKSMK